jgi:hypothetical protein
MSIDAYNELSGRIDLYKKLIDGINQLNNGETVSEYENGKEGGIVDKGEINDGGSLFHFPLYEKGGDGYTVKNALNEMETDSMTRWGNDKLEDKDKIDIITKDSGIYIFIPPEPLEV